MNWKSIISIIALLVIGFVAGFFTNRYLTVKTANKIAALRKAKGMENRLYEILDLEAEQKEQLAPIIKKHFEVNGEVSVIKYPANRTNEFDLLNFNRIFLPFNLNEVPVIPFEEALSFFESEHRDEFTLGMVVLFRKYVNQKRVWELFIKMIKENQVEEIPNSLIYYLAHIPWHPDIWYRGEPINDEIKEYALNEISQFDKDVVVKLLSLIDEETGITRGTIGQSIEAIISKVDNINGILEKIMLDENIELSIKHSSALIYAYYKAEKSLDFLRKLEIEESWFIPELISQLKEYKWINPYG